MANLCIPVSPASAAAPSAIDVARHLNEAFVSIAESATPSVVVVQVAQKAGSEAEGEHPLMDQMPDEWRRRFEEYRDRRRRERAEGAPRFDGEGSGIVYGPEGHILTNAHVVDAAERIRVRFHDGREMEAEVRGVDTDSDIAILRLRGKATGLRPAKFANSDKVRVGEFAIAIGAPYELEYSVTFGHISAKGRAGLSTGMMDEDFIQTDANINPGNSGGPLLNLDGEVVGVNSMIRGVGTGICFAIPSNLAREVADQLVAHGKFRRSWLGVQIQGIREDERLRAAHPDVHDGVFINGVTPGGPAERAGLHVEDIILSVEGRKVGTVAQLRRQITRKAAGSKVSVAIQREGKPRTLSVMLDPMPDPDERIAAARRRRPAPKPEEDIATAMGITVQAPTAALKDKFKLGKADGVVVTAIDESGPLAEYGLRPGDLIVGVDKTDVKTPSQLGEALRDARSSERFTLRYIRVGEKLSAVVLNPGSAKKP
jgi:serine protease Do